MLRVNVMHMSLYMLNSNVRKLNKEHVQAFLRCGISNLQDSDVTIDICILYDQSVLRISIYKYAII